MKMTSTAALFLTCACAVSAALPDAQTLLHYPKAGEKVLVYGTGFENPNASEIKLGPGFRYVPGEGNNGNTGLRVDRSEPIHRTQDTYIVLPGGKITPGFQYRVLVNVKGKGVRHDTRPVPPSSHRFMETVYVDSATQASLPGKTVVPFAPPPDEDGFHEFQYTFPGLPGMAPRIRLALWVDFHGTLWFDDLRVYREGMTANAFLVRPGCGTFFRNSGKFRLKLHIPPEYRKNAVGWIAFEKDGKILREKVIAADASQWIEGDFGTGLPLGAAKLKIVIADTAAKLRLKEMELPVNVRDTEKPPEGAVVMDEHGRMLMDGKSVLPIGIFYSGLIPRREEDYKRLADSAFNFITDYSALSLALPQDPEKIAAIRKELDLMRRYRLKVLFNLISFYVPHSNFVKKGWAGEKGTLNMTRKLVEGIKDHPALLGWYLSDELSLEQLGVPTAMRHLLNQADPYHPAFTLSNLRSALPDYAVSGDVFMLDPYPLCFKKGGKNIDAAITGFMRQAQLPGVPVWVVPQAFNWGVALKKNKPEFEEYLEPDEEDMRSMALLCAIEGAKGFCFYNYPFHWDKVRFEKYFNALGMPDYPEKMWTKIKAAAASVKLLEPYLTSLAEAPSVTVESLGKANTRARAWRSEDGKICLVIVGTGGGNAEAVVTLPGAERLKSKYGRTVHMGGGKYKFTSPDLGSDLLFEQ